MTLTVRLWDFDMDSEVLGPIRCAYFDATKKFDEFEDGIRKGTIDSTTLARDVFQTVACRRIGDAMIDAKCGGGKFSDEEVSMLPSNELDQFCDKLMKGRLWPMATAADAELPSAAPDITPGRAGLAAALLRTAEKNHASMKHTVEAAERNFRVTSVFDAQHAALGGHAAERAMREIQRSEELFSGAISAENTFKSALGQTSMSAATEAMLGIGRNSDMIKAVLGIHDRARSLPDETSLSAAAQALADIKRSEDVFKRSAGIDEHMKSLLDPTSLSAARTLADIRTYQDFSKATLGVDDHFKTTFGAQASTNAVLKAMADSRSFEAARSFTCLPDKFRIAAQDITDIPESKMASRFPARSLDIPIYVPPPNPIHKTNDKLDELIAHRKMEANKKDMDRDEAAIESADNKKIAKSGLFHTKVSVWVGVVAFVVPLGWGVWVFLDAKTDALETEKKTEIQLGNLRAEIRALKVSTPTAKPQSKSDVKISPDDHADSKTR
jgi:hypothetical protein